MGASSIESVFHESECDELFRWTPVIGHDWSRAMMFPAAAERARMCRRLSVALVPSCSASGYFRVGGLENPADRWRYPTAQFETDYLVGERAEGWGVRVIR